MRDKLKEISGRAENVLNAIRESTAHLEGFGGRLESQAQIDRQAQIAAGGGFGEEHVVLAGTITCPCCRADIAVVMTPPAPASTVFGIQRQQPPEATIEDPATEESGGGDTVINIVHECY